MRKTTALSLIASLFLSTSVHAQQEVQYKDLLEAGQTFDSMPLGERRETLVVDQPVEGGLRLEKVIWVRQGVKIPIKDEKADSFVSIHSLLPLESIHYTQEWARINQYHVEDPEAYIDGIAAKGIIAGIALGGMGGSILTAIGLGVHHLLTKKDVTYAFPVITMSAAMIAGAMLVSAWNRVSAQDRLIESGDTIFQFKKTVSEPKL